ncbi:recombinase family protein [Sphingomonas faeni]|uniref:recombinase family protein n=1 Tax=Sphingomonas faeni TaxID=185950 RepID=UPI0020BE73DE|nr:recombinase family protein [Sphingomonas faeni]MCK8458556.1 recombinase family protein [Sphingomonas faeni]
MRTDPSARVRCAIYTRKSSDEGLEQAFNSLDAQREACAAYILSQTSEGWTALPEIYDDGGLSGGTLQRPALQRLLAEVGAGRVDIIVVYKVDRLTRSLLDFSKLVEAFDASNTSFVSVTQSFNTTTSMGRLTLNMLLSFAQFEREVTAERIRDKIAASKAKGMWMGGTPPLGYAPDGRSLSIIDDHAAVIRDIYWRYLDLGNVRSVQQALEAEGIRTPVRTMTTTGRIFGGVPFGRGQIYSILKCATYVGDVVHRGHIYAGLQPAIIERETWDKVQALLTDNRQGVKTRICAARPSLLAGLLEDGAGAPLVATHAVKGKVRYRYYISRALQTGTASAGMRIPAREIETAVTSRITALFVDPLALAATAWFDVAATDIAAYAERCTDLGTIFQGNARMLLPEFVERVRVHDARIEIVCRPVALAILLGIPTAQDAPPTVSIISDVRLTRSGHAMRLVHDNGAPLATAAPDGSLFKLLLKARGWWAQLRNGEIDIKRLAEQEGVNPSYVTRIVRLAFLAPEVVEAILAGRCRVAIDGTSLTATGAVPALWPDQVRMLLPAR